MNNPQEITEFIERVVSNCNTDWHQLEQSMDRLKVEDTYEMKKYFFRVFTAFQILKQDLRMLQEKVHTV